MTQLCLVSRELNILPELSGKLNQKTLMVYFVVNAMKDFQTEHHWTNMNKTVFWAGVIHAHGLDASISTHRNL